MEALWKLNAFVMMYSATVCTYSVAKWMEAAAPFFIYPKRKTS